MRITIFTGNQPRHLALVNRIAQRTNAVYAVLECTTLFPGSVSDFFKKSEVMHEYFGHVQRAERSLFGDAMFSEKNIQTLAVKSGDLNMLEQQHLSAALESDVYIIFGSSFIKGWLADFLVSHNAINMHMGVSPYYRGNSCNFWALYDERPELVGATIHLLSQGLDSGPMLFHALPVFTGEDPFLFTMKAVSVAQQSLVDLLFSGDLFTMDPVIQDRTYEVRYSRNVDFTDEVALSYLRNKMTSQHIEALLNKATLPSFVRAVRI
jgi:folate-dependent phosphoribosylglycinamide formyltransferase PurN